MEIDFSAVVPQAIVFPDWSEPAPERQPPITDQVFVYGSSAGTTVSVTGSTQEPPISGI